MQTDMIQGIRLMFRAEEAETAGLIAEAIEDSLHLTERLWGLNPPEDCRVYVMTGWFSFIFRSAPWPWKLLLGSTMPFWVARARRTWPYSAAWTQRYGRRTAIGIKPPELLEKSDKSVGMHMYVEEPDPAQKIRQLTCHELVHACSAHLRLPAWLNEGIATVTVDHLLAKQTIRQDTLALVRSFQPKATPPSYRALSHLQGQTLAYHAVRGYWLVLYLQDKLPGFLKEMFLNPKKLAGIENEMTGGLGMERGKFWEDIDELMAAR